MIRKGRYAMRDTQMISAQYGEVHHPIKIPTMPRFLV